VAAAADGLVASAPLGPVQCVESWVVVGSGVAIGGIASPDPSLYLVDVEFREGAEKELIPAGSRRLPRSRRRGLRLPDRATRAGRIRCHAVRRRPDPGC